MLFRTKHTALINKLNQTLQGGSGFDCASTTVLVGHAAPQSIVHSPCRNITPLQEVLLYQSQPRGRCRRTYCPCVGFVATMTQVDFLDKMHSDNHSLHTSHRNEIRFSLFISYFSSTQPIRNPPLLTFHSRSSVAAPFSCVNMASPVHQDRSSTPIPPRPAPFLTPSLDRALRQLKLNEYRYSTPDPKSQDGTRTFIDFAQHNPSPIRGLTPPSDHDTTLIPIGIGIRYWIWDKKKHEWAVKESFKWVAVTWAQLLELHELVVPAERCFFAICLDGQPCSLFFDLDCGTGGDNHMDDFQIMQEMNRLLRAFFSNSLHRDLDVSSMMWATSSSPTKTSLHCHCPTASFGDIGAMKQVVRQFKEFVTNQVTTIKPGWIDDIYTKNRNFRCVFSCKPGKVELRPLLAVEQSMAELLWKSLPSYCVHPDSLIHVDRTAVEPADEKKKKSAKRRRSPSPPPRSLSTLFRKAESVRSATKSSTLGTAPIVVLRRLPMRRRGLQQKHQSAPLHSPHNPELLE